MLRQTPAPQLPPFMVEKNSPVNLASALHKQNLPNVDMSKLQRSLDVPVKVKMDTTRDVDNLPSIDQSCLFTPKSTKKSNKRFKKSPPTS